LWVLVGFGGVVGVSLVFVGAVCWWVGFGYDASQRFWLIFGILGVVWGCGHEVLYGRPSASPKMGIQKPVQISSISALPKSEGWFERGWCDIWLFSGVCRWLGVFGFDNLGLLQQAAAQTRVLRVCDKDCVCSVTYITCNSLVNSLRGIFDLLRGFIVLWCASDILLPVLATHHA